MIIKNKKETSKNLIALGAFLAFYLLSNTLEERNKYKAFISF